MRGTHRLALSVVYFTKRYWKDYLEVDSADSIEHVKQEILDKESIPPEESVDSADSIEHVKQEILDKESIPPEVDSADSIEHVKQEIQDKEGIPPTSNVLFLLAINLKMGGP